MEESLALWSLSTFGNFEPPLQQTKHAFFHQCFYLSNQPPASTNTRGLFLWGLGLCNSPCLTSWSFCWPHFQVCQGPCELKLCCFDVLCMSATSTHMHIVLYHTTFGVGKIQKLLSLLPAFTAKSFVQMRQRRFYRSDWDLQRQNIYGKVINALSWEESNRGQTSGKRSNCSACPTVLFSNLAVGSRKKWHNHLFPLWKFCACI